MLGMSRDSRGAVGSSDGGTRSVISADLEIDGEIVSKGAVDVMGQVRGNIDAADVSVAESGRVTGSIHAATATLRGKVRGEVVAGSVNIHASARIEADVSYAAIGIEYGAEVVGALRLQNSAPAPAAEPRGTGTQG